MNAHIFILESRVCKSPLLHSHKSLVTLFDDDYSMFSSSRRYLIPLMLLSIILFIYFLLSTIYRASPDLQRIKSQIFVPIKFHISSFRSILYTLHSTRSPFSGFGTEHAFFGLV